MRPPGADRAIMNRPSPTDSSAQPAKDAPAPTDEVGDARMTIWQHLEELRRRVIAAICGIVVTTVGAWCIRTQLLAWLVVPYQRTWIAKFHKPLVLQTLAPADAFLGYLELSLMAGIVAAVPLVFYELWAFISPGLYKKEKRLIVPFVVFSTTLFLGGVAFAYYVAFPFTFNYFLSLLGPINEGVEVTQIVTLEFFLDFSTRSCSRSESSLSSRCSSPFWCSRISSRRGNSSTSVAGQRFWHLRSVRWSLQARGDEPDRGERRPRRPVFHVDPHRFFASPPTGRRV